MDFSAEEGDEVRNNRVLDSGEQCVSRRSRLNNDMLSSLFVCWVELWLPATLDVKAIGVRMSIESKLDFQIQIVENHQKSKKGRGSTFAAVRGRPIANNID